MPVLRLFGPARLCAGTGRADVPGVSVAEVLDEATRRFGPSFAEIATSSRLWVNGQAADRQCPLDDRDEVAVLPPVSGG
jgi:molybdopterin converting factor small subunit